MGNVDAMINSLQKKKLFDERYKDEAPERIVREQLYQQTIQTEYLANINKGIKTILTIIVVLLALNLLAVGLYVFLSFIQ
ncbi:hypothetical protein [Costertonia aggregata]|uniref:Uncharacterized protein n=1 Tax=Costertonia aggregata TaxID=343403 RepID=A0A7H9ARJ4_9FLAO|nr:hypothetical protein [Costertonia aggregata]QLG46027.1 hypothetical protein HYG79_11960 [Costertonia aggregata]